MTEYDGAERSKTEQLRKLLDDRGVKWKALSDRQDGDYTITATRWHDSEGGLLTMCICEPDGSTWDFFWYPTPEQAVEATLGRGVTGETSDGYHTFNDLYHHRAVLFSVIVRDHRELAWKSKEHHDGTMYDGMFIVGIETPEGQATYHYDIDPYWDMFDCKELDRAPEWDGHTPDDAIERIGKLGRGTCKLEQHGSLADQPSMVCWSCSKCGFGWHHSIYDKQFSYCPNCGRMVEK